MAGRGKIGLTKEMKDELIGPADVYIRTSFTLPQYDFYNFTCRYKILVKGRRWGATISAAQYCIREMVNRVEPISILWVDVTYKNIGIYYETYIRPILSQIPRQMYEWSEQKKILKIHKPGKRDYSALYMRSADRPENLEGFSYNIIILNEAGIILKDRNLWLMSIAPMAIDKKAIVYFLGTPKGKYEKDGRTESLFYTLYKRGLPGTHRSIKKEDGKVQANLWKSWKYTSYDNPTLTKEQINDIMEDVPQVLRQQEIYAEFCDILSDAVFKEAWFPIIDDVPEVGVLRKILSLDTAFKAKQDSDYSAGVLIYQTVDSFYIVDMFCERLEFPGLVRKTQDMYDLYNPDLVLIEDRASGQSLIQTLQTQTTMPLHPYSPDKDKHTRACAITFICEHQRVKLLRGPWNVQFINQLSNFPSGNDDIVDALSQGLTYMKDYKGKMPRFVSTSLRNPDVYSSYGNEKLKDTLIAYDRKNYSNPLQGYN